MTQRYHFRVEIQKLGKRISCYVLDLSILTLNNFSAVVSLVMGHLMNDLVRAASSNSEVHVAAVRECSLSFPVLVFRALFEVGGFEINEGKDHHTCPVRLVKIRIKSLRA